MEPHEVHISEKLCFNHITIPPFPLLLTAFSPQFPSSPSSSSLKNAPRTPIRDSVLSFAYCISIFIVAHKRLRFYMHATLLVCIQKDPGCIFLLCFAWKAGVPPRRTVLTNINDSCKTTKHSKLNIKCNTKSGFFHSTRRMVASVWFCCKTLMKINLHIFGGGERDINVQYMNRNEFCQMHKIQL